MARDVYIYYAPKSEKSAILGSTSPIDTRVCLGQFFLKSQKAHTKLDWKLTYNGTKTWY